MSEKDLERIKKMVGEIELYSVVNGEVKAKKEFSDGFMNKLAHSILTYIRQEEVKLLESLVKEYSYMSKDGRRVVSLDRIRSAINKIKGE